MASLLADPRLAEKYSRLMLVRDIGPAGFERIRGLRAAVVGCGATGSHVVDYLARLGVAYIRVIDSDFLDISNIYRMSLVTERDAEEALPKAVACARRAREVNSDVVVEPFVERLDASTASRLLSGVDIVFDATDNFRTRFLINEYSVAHGVPWVYMGVEGWYANVMLIEPGRGPCLNCIIPRLPAREEANVCDIIGVFPTVVSIAASIAVSIAVRHLLGRGDYTGRLYVIDAARVAVDAVTVKRNPQCTVCVRREYRLLRAAEKPSTVTARPVCGTEAVEVRPPEPLDIDPFAAAEKLGDVAAVNEYLVKTRHGGLTVVLFRDGRAIVDGTVDVERALKAYTELAARLGLRLDTAKAGDKSASAP